MTRTFAKGHFEPDGQRQILTATPHPRAFARFIVRNVAGIALSTIIALMSAAVTRPR